MKPKSYHDAIFVVVTGCTGGGPPTDVLLYVDSEENPWIGV